jgi:uncharacterized protein
LASANIAVSDLAKIVAGEKGAQQLTQKTTDCRSCGACCSFSRDWPRFTLETDADIALIPEEFVDATSSGMRCDGNRCSALLGEVGVSTACSVYSRRPDVCRACEPGDDACQIARLHFHMDATPVC